MISLISTSSVYPFRHPQAHVPPAALKNDALQGEQIQVAVKSGAGKVTTKVVDKVFDAGTRYTMAHARIHL
jgi:hypothetical protein